MSLCIPLCSKQLSQCRALTNLPLFCLYSPWKAAILYVLGMSKNAHYDTIFSSQFSDLDQYKALPMRDFIDKLCDSFTRYQRFTEENQYQIIPTEKQKRFLEKIICGEECFHFSEVGSGKTKVWCVLYYDLVLNQPTHHNCIFYFPASGYSTSTLSGIPFV